MSYLPTVRWLHLLVMYEYLSVRVNVFKNTFQMSTCITNPIWPIKLTLFIAYIGRFISRSPLNILVNIFNSVFIYKCTNSSTNSLELKLTMHSRVSTNSTISTMEAACLLYKFYYKHIRLKHFLQFSFEEGLFYRSNSTSSSSESLSSSSPSTSGESHGNGSVDRRLKKSTRILLQEI